jgi:hypothetical protein
MRHQIFVIDRVARTKSRRLLRDAYKTNDRLIEPRTQELGFRCS